MQARLGRPDRDAEHRGDPWERQIEIQVQDDHGAGLGLESGQRPVEQVAVGDLSDAVGRGGFRISFSSTSMTRRRRLRMRSMQALATRLRSQ
jgi:hypothetical protein